MQSLPLTTQTAYAELLDQLMVLDATRSIGSAPGAFVTKTLQSRVYYYFQYSMPGGSTKQVYIGPQTAQLDALARRYAEERDALRGDRETIVSLCAVLRAGGAGVTDPTSARVISALADAGVFKLGGVLVGTHALVVLGNVLGVRFTGSHKRTQDIDVGAKRTLEIAVPEIKADVPTALESLGMGFLPIPGFSPKHPSTLFSVRKKGIRLDLITPAKGDVAEGGAPIPIPRFNAAAAPVRYLDYLLEETQPGVVVNGGGVLVQVPSPARYAILKLLVAQDRSPAFQTKARKDLAQAAAVIEALEETRPGDVRQAFDTARSRGRRWVQAANRATKLLELHHPEASGWLKA